MPRRAGGFFQKESVYTQGVVPSEVFLADSPGRTRFSGSLPCPCMVLECPAGSLPSSAGEARISKAFKGSAAGYASNQWHVPRTHLGLLMRRRCWTLSSSDG